MLFRDAAGTWLDQHLGADSSIATYRSVLRSHIDPAIGSKPIGTIRREDIKAIIAAMRRKGLSASRIGCAYLVVSAVLAEAVRDKKLPESPCSCIQLPGIVTAADFILPAYAQVEAVAVGLPPDWAATVWLMHGCGLRIGEAIDKHVAEHGTTSDGYLFQGRKYKLVVRRSYQEDFQRSAAGAGMPPEFIPTRCATCTPRPRWLRESRSPRYPGGLDTRASKSPTRSTVTSSPPPSNALEPLSTPPTRTVGIGHHEIPDLGVMSQRAAFGYYRGSLARRGTSSLVRLLGEQRGFM